MTKDEVLKMALEALEYHTAQTRPIIETMATINVIKEVLAQPNAEYERGFVDGMQKQMQSSVDKAVNMMAQPEQYSDLISNGGLDPRNKFDAQPEQEPYLGKAYRLANELRGHLAIAPLPKRKWVSTSDFDRADLWHQDPKIAMAALEQFLKLANT